MKRAEVLLLIIFLSSIVSAYGIHDASVSLTSPTTAQYETKDVDFKFNIKNIDDSLPTVNDSINNFILSTNGISYLYVYPKSGWLYINNTNSINWNTATAFILPDEGQSFNFKATLGKVDSNQVYTWTVITNDTNGYIDTNTFNVQVLNDAISPTVSISYPKDYTFIKNEQFNFEFGASDTETGIDDLEQARIEADDNSNPQSVGAGNITRSLTYFSGVYFTSFDPSILDPTLNYLDYKIYNVRDKAGNSYTDSIHHIYIDKGAPVLAANFGTVITNNKAETFSFNISDNSFETLTNGFSPGLKCNLNIDGTTNKINFYTNNQSNSVVTSNLSLVVDGDHTLVYTCEDNATYSSSISKTFTLDTTGPAISLSELNGNGEVIADGTLINFTASDDRGVSSVWYNHSNTITILPVASKYSIDTSTWSEGLNSVKIYANDSLNNINETQFDFTIDANPPNIEYLAPTSGLLTNTTVLIKYKANDTYSSTLDCVTWATNGTYYLSDLRSVSKGILTSFYMNLDNDGSWIINTTCTDEAKHDGFNKTDVLVDAIAPVITLYEPNKIYLNYSDLEFNYNVYDNQGTPKECSLYLDNVLNLTNSSLGLWYVNSTFKQSLADGDYRWRVDCEDSVSNVGSSETREIIVDTVNPNITLNYNKLSLEKQIDNLIVNFSVNETYEDYKKLYVNDSSNNVINETISENTNLILSGLELGKGIFTINAYANDSAGNSDSKVLSFEIVDTMAPIILSNIPTSGSSLSSTSSVSINLTTDEVANCKYSTNGSKIYTEMSNMDTTDSKLHTLIASVSSGNSYNYYFACSDGANTMSSNYNITFSINSPSNPTNSNNNGGGGGGHRDEEVSEEPKTPVVTPIKPKEEIKAPAEEKKPEETAKTETTNSEQGNENKGNFMTMTGLAMWNGVNKYRKESLVASSAIALGLLGSWGFVRFRRYKLLRMHRPPFNNSPPLN